MVEAAVMPFVSQAASKPLASLKRPCAYFFYSIREMSIRWRKSLDGIVKGGETARSTFFLKDPLSTVAGQPY